MQKKQMPKEVKNELKSAQALREEAIQDHVSRLLRNGNIREFLPLQKNLAKFMLDLLVCPERETIYNPFAGAGSFSHIAPENHFVQREINEQACEIAKLRAEEHKVTPLIEMCDPMQKSDEWDYIIAVPPFIPNMLDNVVRHLYSQLKDEGSMCLLLPASFAYTHSCRSSKELLLKECALQDLCMMPTGILPNTDIATVVVRITKSSALKKHEGEIGDPIVSLWDLTDLYVENKRMHTRELSSNLLAEVLADELINSDSHGIGIPYSKLKDNGYNLLPQFYLSGKVLESFQHDYPMVTLGELLQSVPQEKVSADCKKISMKDLAKGEIVLTTDFETVESTKCEGKACYLQNGDILVALVGAKLRPTIYSGKNSLPVMLSSNIAVLRVRQPDTVSPEYIAAELSALYAQKHIDMFRVGIAQQFISLQILLDEVQIELPSPEEQQKRLLQRTIETQKRVLEQQGIAYDELLDARRNDYHKRMRARKHAIGQVLNHMDPALDTLMRFMKMHNGILRDKDMVSQRYERTVSDYFDSLRSQLSQVIQMVNHLTDGEQYGQPEDVHVCGLVKKYIDSHPASSNFRFDQIWDHLPNDFDGMKAGEPIDLFQISIAPEDFFQVLDNIVANATKYGFTEKGNEDYCIRISNKESILHGQPAVDILIANNGSPLPKGMTEENVFAYGASSSGSSGIGGSQMKDIVEHFGGEIRLNSYPNAQDGYTIEYIITLPVNNILQISL